MSNNQLKHQIRVLDDKLSYIANWYKTEYNDLQRLINGNKDFEHQLKPIISRLKRCERNAKQILNENKKLLSETEEWIKQA